MASVRKRVWVHKGVEKTAWVVDYTDQQGKRRMRTEKTKKEADKAKLRIEMEIERGEHVATAQTKTVKEVCDNYLLHYEQRKKDGTISYATLKQAMSGIGAHIVPVLGALKFSELCFADLERFYKGMRKGGLSALSARHYLVILLRIERYAITRGWTKKQLVIEAIKEFRVGTPAKVKTFSVDDIKALVAAAEVHKKRRQVYNEKLMRCFLHLAAFCGLRIGEICALTLDAVNFQDGVIHVRHSLSAEDELKGPKTKAGIRDVPLPRHLASILDEWIKDYMRANDRNLLFRASRWSGPIQGTNFTLFLWRQLLEDAGLKPEDGKWHHFHALRHFAASHMIEMGLSLTDTASLLGHSKFDVTLQVYAHPIIGGNRRKEMFEKMASAINLDATTERQRLLTA